MKILKYNDYVNEAYVSNEKMDQVKKDLKSTFPEFKFSIRKRDLMSVNVSILSGPISLTDNPDGYEQINQYQIKNRFKDKPEVANFLQQVHDIMDKGNHDNSDLMTDYHDVGFYTHLEIGQWDKPYVIHDNIDKTIPKKKKPKLDLGKSYIDKEGNLMSFESFKNRK